MEGMKHMALNSVLMANKTLSFLRENPDYSMVRLEAMYNAAAPVHGVRAGDGLVIIESVQQHILRAEDVLWAYAQQNNIRVSFIPMGSPSNVQLWTSRGENIIIATMTQKRSREVLEYLFPRLTGTVFGHSQELVKLWNSGKDDGHASFRFLARQQHQQG